MSGHFDDLAVQGRPARPTCAVGGWLPTNEPCGAFLMVTRRCGGDWHCRHQKSAAPSPVEPAQLIQIGPLDC